jgi:hypothetical protein
MSICNDIRTMHYSSGFVTVAAEQSISQSFRPPNSPELLVQVLCWVAWLALIGALLPLPIFQITGAPKKQVPVARVAV